MVYLDHPWLACKKLIMTSSIQTVQSDLVLHGGIDSESAIKR